MSEGPDSSSILAYQRSMSWRDLLVGVGATLLFFFTVPVVPMIGIFASVLTPLPTLLGYYRWGRPLGYWIPAGVLAVGAVMLAALGSLQSLGYLSELILLGLLLGKAMRANWSVDLTIGSSSLVVFVLGTVLFWIGHGGAPGGLFTGLEKELQLTLAAMFKAYGGDASQQAFFQSTLRELVPFLVRLLPGLAAASIVLIAWFNVLMARYYCRLNRVPQPAWQSWAHWKSPEPLVWIVIAAGFMAVLPLRSVKLVGLNLLLALGTVYLLHGLAIVVFYCERWKVPGLLRGLGYGLIFLQQFASLFVMLLGLFDIWFDFRKLSKKGAPGTAPPGDQV